MSQKYPELRDPEWLRRTYCDERKTLQEIADGLGCSVTTVHAGLQRAQIPRRPARGNKPTLLDKHGARVKELYAQGLTAKQIGEQLGFGRQTAYNILTDLGVERRQPADRRAPGLDEPTLREMYVTRRLSCARIANELDVSKSAVEKRLHEYGIPVRGRRLGDDPRVSEASLRKLYIEEQLPVKDIAERIGVGSPTLYRYLAQWGIPLRARGQHGRAARAKQHGLQRTRWVNNQGYVMISYITESGSVRKVPEHRRVMELSLGRVLASSEQVHHINGDKLDNRLENLQLRQGAHGSGVVLRCNSCGSHDVTPAEIAEPT